MRVPVVTRAAWGWGIPALVAVGILNPSMVSASPYIEVKVSVKIILDPFTSSRPTIEPGSTVEVSDGLVAAMVNRADNLLLAEYWRGYRFVLDEVVTVGSYCPAPSCTNENPSYYFGDPFASDGSLVDFETEAMSHPAYLWRNDAINVYVNQGKGNGAVSSFPYAVGRSNHITVVGSEAFDPNFSPNFLATVFHHELGHYFDLAHPNAKTTKECCDISVLCFPEDGDGIEDTLPDNPCYALDNLCIFHYGVFYTGLNPAQRDNIDNIWTNNMTYMHPSQSYGVTIMDRLTEKQLDRWADTANSVRAAVVSGRTRFVERCLGCVGSGTSTNPYGSVFQGHLNAVDGDILLLRPGQYNETLTLDKRVTLRATRTGPAVIGR